MSQQILLNLGEDEKAIALHSAVKSYAKSLGISQKKLLLMALYGFMLENKEFEFAETVATYFEK